MNEIEKFLEKASHAWEELEEMRLEWEAMEKDPSGLKAVQYDRPHVSGGELHDLSYTLVKKEEAEEAYKRRWFQRLDYIFACGEAVREIARLLPSNSILPSIILSAYGPKPIPLSKLGEDLNVSKAVGLKLHRQAIQELTKNHYIQVRAIMARVNQLTKGEGDPQKVLGAFD